MITEKLMGDRQQLICSDCGYEATVSGGDDRGIVCHTTTICCEDCRELFDVVTSTELQDDSDSSPGVKLVCPGVLFDEPAVDGRTRRANPGHRVRRWTFPGPCPKCGHDMSTGKYTVQWD